MTRRTENVCGLRLDLVVAALGVKLHAEMRDFEACRRQLDKLRRVASEIESHLPPADCPRRTASR